MGTLIFRDSQQPSRRIEQYPREAPSDGGSISREAAEVCGRTRRETRQRAKPIRDRVFVKYTPGETARQRQAKQAEVETISRSTSLEGFEA